MPLDCICYATNQEFDYILLSDLLCSLWDIQAVLQNVKKLITPRTKIIISAYNYLWEPTLRFGEFLGLKDKQPLQSWLSVKDINNLNFSY